MVGVCYIQGCEALCFTVIRIGHRLEWWTCSKHRRCLLTHAGFEVRLWERIFVERPSALVMEDPQDWRTWAELTLSAYDELQRQTGV